MNENFKELLYNGAKFLVGDKGTIYYNNKVYPVRYNRDGYQMLSYKGNNGWTTVGVHILVARAFIPNDDESQTEVNHRDFDRKNNRADNLEWVSHKDNILYSRKHYSHYGSDNPNYGNRKLSKFYKDNPIISKLKQGRSGLKNGRCRKIKLYHQGVYIKEFGYIGLCCQYLKEHCSPNSSIETIRGQIDSHCRTNKPYKGYTFVKE